MAVTRPLNPTQGRMFQPEKLDRRWTSVTRPWTEQQREREADQHCGDQVLRLEYGAAAKLTRKLHRLIDDVTPCPEAAAFHAVTSTVQDSNKPRLRSFRPAQGTLRH